MTFWVLTMWSKICSLKATPVLIHNDSKNDLDIKACIFSLEPLLVIHCTSSLWCCLTSEENLWRLCFHLFILLVMLIKDLCFGYIINMKNEIYFLQKSLYNVVYQRLTLLLRSPLSWSDCLTSARCFWSLNLGGWFSWSEDTSKNKSKSPTH